MNSHTLVRCRDGFRSSSRDPSQPLGRGHEGQVAAVANTTPDLRPLANSLGSRRRPMERLLAQQADHRAMPQVRPPPLRRPRTRAVRYERVARSVGLSAVAKPVIRGALRPARRVSLRSTHPARYSLLARSYRCAASSLACMRFWLSSASALADPGPWWQRAAGGSSVPEPSRAPGRGTLHGSDARTRGWIVTSSPERGSVSAR
jgi:hypothetical protein